MQPVSCTIRRLLTISQEEVDDVVLMSMDEILRAAENGENFTPDSIHACREYIKVKGCPAATTNRPDVTFR
jgi:hypothetical protein